MTASRRRDFAGEGTRATHAQSRAAVPHDSMKKSITEAQRLLRAAAEAEVKEPIFRGPEGPRFHPRGRGSRATSTAEGGCATQSFHLKILIHREALRRLGIGWAGVRGGDGEAAVSVAGAVGVKTAAVAAHQQIAGR